MVGAVRASLFVLLLIGWGNVSATLVASTPALPGGSAASVAIGLALVALSVGVARGLRLDTADLGLRGPHVRGAALGAALGAGLAAASVLALLLLAPVVLGQRMAYAPLARTSVEQLLPHVALILPLAVVIPEELAFRGVLLGAIVRGTSVRTGALVGASAFALWHVAVALSTVGQTTLAGAWAAVGVAGALSAVAVAGALFVWLRLRTGTLATTIAAHWAFNAVLLLGLWAVR